MCWLSRFLPLFAVSLVAGHLAAQPSNPDEDSCRRFAQAFYDWYVPLTHKRLKGPAWDLALRQRAAAFAPELLQALKTDVEAQARTTDDIVGIDFDPFVGSQDPASHYQIQRVLLQGNWCSVEVGHASANRTKAKSDKPDAIAELIRVAGRWQFANFRYPELNTELKKILAELAEDRRKH